MRVRVEGTAAAVHALLCRDHTNRLARNMTAHLARMRAENADVASLHGRRLRDGEALDVIREWARTAGYPVSTSGSVSSRIVAAYREAHAGGSTPASCEPAL